MTLALTSLVPWTHLLLVNIVLGPNAGPLGRTPLGGRNWEGFSVDPYLSGQLNAETVIGHQDAGVIANIKVQLLPGAL